MADDGRGIEPGRRDEALAEGHIGLASVDERVPRGERVVRARELARGHARGAPDLPG